MKAVFEMVEKEKPQQVFYWLLPKKLLQKWPQARQVNCGKKKQPPKKSSVAETVAALEKSFADNNDGETLVNVFDLMAGDVCWLDRCIDVASISKKG